MTLCCRLSYWVDTFITILSIYWWRNYFFSKFIDFWLHLDLTLHFIDNPNCSFLQGYNDAVQGFLASSTQVGARSPGLSWRQTGATGPRHQRRHESVLELDVLEVPRQPTCQQLLNGMFFSYQGVKNIIMVGCITTKLVSINY